MECIPKNTILQFHPDTLVSVRKSFGLDKPDDMDRAIDVLNYWVQQQKHFTKKDFSRDYLERTIITSKGSVEKAKARLDKGCTLRGLMPRFFVDYNPRTDYKDLDGLVTHALLPKLTNNHNRVFILRNVGKKFESTLILHYFRFLILFVEYARAHDYFDGFIIVIDYQNVNLMELSTSLNIVDMRQGLSILIEAYGARLKGIHILSQSKFIDLVVAIFKQVMSAKLGERIQVHKTLDTVYDYIPKEVLPVEYGGKERSLEELHNAWVDVLSSEESLQYQREMNAVVTDESLRQTDAFNDQYMGMPGTFRSLSVD